MARQAQHRTNRVSAAVPAEQVLRAWYDRIPPDSWAWAQALYVGDSDSGFLVAEDDDGYLWRIPYEVSGTDIDFGEPSRVRTEFVPTNDDTGDRESVTVQAGMRVVHCARPGGEGRPADIYLRQRTVAAAVASHSTDTSDGDWNGAENEKRLPSPMPLETARAVYAWIDDTQVQDD